MAAPDTRPCCSVTYDDDPLNVAAVAADPASGPWSCPSVTPL